MCQICRAIRDCNELLRYLLSGGEVECSEVRLDPEGISIEISDLLKGDKSPSRITPVAMLAGDRSSRIPLIIAAADKIVEDDPVLSISRTKFPKDVKRILGETSLTGSFRDRIEFAGAPLPEKATVARVRGRACCIIPHTPALIAAAFKANHAQPRKGASIS